ncbi:MAG: hypothetical protein EBY32_17675 [Proteobacteria bacterium]|jgi:hypothetical protein|nr:hypothetical protein [Pseudomonadota bacterium]
MPLETAQKIQDNISRTTSRIDPRFVDVKPLQGFLSTAESEAIMKTYGLRPVTREESKLFRKFVSRK